MEHLSYADRAGSCMHQSADPKARRTQQWIIDDALATYYCLFQRFHLPVGCSKRSVVIVLWQVYCWPAVSMTPWTIPLLDCISFKTMVSVLDDGWVSNRFTWVLTECEGVLSGGGGEVVNVFGDKGCPRLKVPYSHISNLTCSEAVGLLTMPFCHRSLHSEIRLLTILWGAL